MYYQMYILNEKGQRCQHNLDSWEEVQELIEARRPGTVELRYFDSDGWIGTAWKKWQVRMQQYVTYKKESRAAICDI